MEFYTYVANYNLKRNLSKHIVLAAILCLVSPIFIGVSNLDVIRVSKIIDTYLSFLGIILLVPIFIPDEDKSIREVILTKKQPMILSHMIRLVEENVLLVLLNAGYLLFLEKNHCTFSYSIALYAAFANGLFLGGLGVLSYSIINHMVIGYMIPFLYYIFNMSGGSKYLGEFRLFAFSGDSIGNKKYLMVTGLIMIIVALFIRNKFKKI